MYFTSVGTILLKFVNETSFTSVDGMLVGWEGRPVKDIDEEGLEESIRWGPHSHEKNLS